MLLEIVRISREVGVASLVWMNPNSQQIGASLGMSESSKLRPSSKLHCPSCGRSAGMGPNRVDTLLYLAQEWCVRCARIIPTSGGKAWVAQPSPGRMGGGPTTNPLDAWIDCYVFKPKRRIKVDEAKREIQRAWAMWNGDKGDSEAMFVFFGWLRRHSPFFLTFRTRGDRWQRVHAWLLQCERASRQRVE